MAHETGERLQKALARLGLASRREAEEWIRAGRLTVNGHIATLGERVGATDQIRLDGRLVRRRPPAESQVFIYHRSPGESLSQPHAHTEDHESDVTVSTTPDGTARETLSGDGHRNDSGTTRPPQRLAPVLDRLPRRAGRRFIAISPMPTIDGGLELLTSDGELAVKLQRSVRRLESEFSVRVRGELDETHVRQIREGVLDRGAIDVRAFEARGGEGANRWYVLIARGASGKDLRQLFQRQGAVVSRVLRTRLGPVTLDRRLGRSQFRKLSAAEIESLLTAASRGDERPPPRSSRGEARPGRPRQKRSRRRR